MSLRTVSSGALAPSTEIDGRLAALSEVIFQPSDFGRLCRLIWRKPDTAVALIAGVSDRAARDYLSGKVPMPADVLAVINVAITKRN